MNCSCKRVSGAERGSYHTRVPDFQATDCVMEIKDREWINRCMSVAVCFEVVHNNITPICFLSMWNCLRDSNFIYTWPLEIKSTIQLIVYGGSPFEKSLFDFYGKSIFSFFLLACYFLSLSMYASAKHTQSQFSLLESTCVWIVPCACHWDI